MTLVWVFISSPRGKTTTPVQPSKPVSIMLKLHCLFSHIKHAKNVTCSFTRDIKKNTLIPSFTLAHFAFLFLWCHKSSLKVRVWSQRYNLIPNTTSRKTFPPAPTYFGGQSVSSRNSSILLISVFTSPLKVRKGGCVPGARLCRSAGFL